MKEKLDNKINRREFFLTLGRYAALTGMGVGIGKLIIQRPDKADPHVCISKGLCDGCGAFNNCGLPQALSAKQACVQAQPVKKKVKKGAR